MSIQREFKKIIDRLFSFFEISSFENPSEPKISANIICKNNIKCIKTCVESLIGSVDEIIVVDTGSTDGTLEILNDYSQRNLKVIKEPEFKGYSYHRNQAIANSSGDWIIVLDSDEYLSCSLKRNLRSLASSKIYSAYRIYRRWLQFEVGDDNNARFILTKKFKGRYKPIIRFFRNLSFVRYRGDMHESVFGLEQLRVKKLRPDENTIYHLDVAINSVESRLCKVLSRNTAVRGSGHPEEYLPELFNIETRQVPHEDLEFLKYLMSV